jgi:hypothetical protein
MIECWILSDKNAETYRNHDFKCQEIIEVVYFNPICFFSNIWETNMEKG